MGEHTKILLKLDHFAASAEKEPTSRLSDRSLQANVETVPAVKDASSKQQTMEIHITAPDVAAMVSTKLRGSAVILFLVAALIVGFNKDSDRMWKLGVRMEKKKRAHISVVPFSFLFAFDQIFSYWMIILCAFAWTDVKSQNCLKSFSEGYCQMAQAGVAFSFMGWMALNAPSVMTTLSLGGKLRDALIEAKAAARWERKLWQ